jgi:hypothetical protein
MAETPVRLQEATIDEQPCKKVQSNITRPFADDDILNLSQLALILKTPANVKDLAQDGVLTLVLKLRVG